MNNKRRTPQEKHLRIQITRPSTSSDPRQPLASGKAPHYMPACATEPAGVAVPASDDTVLAAGGDAAASAEFAAAAPAVPSSLVELALEVLHEGGEPESSDRNATDAVCCKEAADFGAAHRLGVRPSPRPTLPTPPPKPTPQTHSGKRPSQRAPTPSGAPARSSPSGPRTQQQRPRGCRRARHAPMRASVSWAGGTRPGCGGVAAWQAGGGGRGGGGGGGGCSGVQPLWSRSGGWRQQRRPAAAVEDDAPSATALKQPTTRKPHHPRKRAVDLAWDVIARWGSDPTLAPHLPRQFFDDFVAVAEDEARHFTLLEARLREAGSHYGALPVHDS